MAAVCGRQMPDVVGYPRPSGRRGSHNHACVPTQNRSNRETIMNRLKGKVAMVVGAGSIGPGWGNGKATAVTFAREGARGFWSDPNTAAAEERRGLITGEGGPASAFAADVARAGEVEAMVAACLKTYGR